MDIQVPFRSYSEYLLDCAFQAILMVSSLGLSQCMLGAYRFNSGSHQWNSVTEFYTHYAIINSFLPQAKQSANLVPILLL